MSVAYLKATVATVKDATYWNYNGSQLTWGSSPVNNGSFGIPNNWVANSNYGTSTWAVLSGTTTTTFTATRAGDYDISILLNWGITTSQASSSTQPVYVNINHSAIGTVATAMVTTTTIANTGLFGTSASVPMQVGDNITINGYMGNGSVTPSRLSIKASKYY